MEKIKPRPNTIKNDLVSLSVKIGLSKAFGAMNNPDAAKEMEEKTYSLGERILNRVEEHRHQYAQLYHALRDMRRIDPSMHSLVVRALHMVQRERIPIKRPEPKKSMVEV